MDTGFEDSGGTCQGQLTNSVSEFVALLVIGIYTSIGGLPGSFLREKI